MTRTNASGIGNALIRNEQFYPLTTQWGEGLLGLHFRYFQQYIKIKLCGFAANFIVINVINGWVYNGLIIFIYFKYNFQNKVTK